MVKEKGVDPVEAQIILENLYHSGWINYPRSDNEKARYDPVVLVRDPTDFSGTVQEREMINMIDQANLAQAEGRNFIKHGNWVVYVNQEEILRKESTKTILIPDRYNKHQFDVVVDREGKSDLQITEFLHKNQIGTPATRMVLLAELKQSGITKKVNERFVVDSRGVIMAAAYDYMINHGELFDAVELGKRCYAAKTIDEIELILTEIIPTNAEKLTNEIREFAKPRIEAQKDLATLDTF